MPEERLKDLLQIWGQRKLFHLEQLPLHKNTPFGEFLEKIIFLQN